MLTGCSESGRKTPTKTVSGRPQLITEKNESVSSEITIGAKTISSEEEITSTNEIENTSYYDNYESIGANELETKSSPITDFEYKTNDYGEIVITKYIGQDSIVIIPSETDGKPISELDHKAFYDCTHITDITIPDSILTIGLLVFNGCDNLLNINVDDNNINFSSKDGVLFNKDSSYLIQFPCGRNGDYSIPSGTEAIGSKAFQDCKQLLSVTIPDSVTTLDDGAFYRCSRLKSVKGCENISVISPGAFGYCKSLSDIEFSDNLKTIEFDAFTDCDMLSQIVFPDSLSELGARAIDGCLKIHVKYKGKIYDYYEREQLRQDINNSQNYTDNQTNLSDNSNENKDDVPSLDDIKQSISNFESENTQYLDAINELAEQYSKCNDMIVNCDEIINNCENKISNGYATGQTIQDMNETKQLKEDYEALQIKILQYIIEYKNEIQARENAIAFCQSIIDEYYPNER